MIIELESELQTPNSQQTTHSGPEGQNEIREWIAKLSEAYAVSMREIQKESHGMDLTPHSLEALDEFIDDGRHENGLEEFEVVERIGAYIADVIQHNNNGMWMEAEEGYAFVFETGFAVNPWQWAIFKLKSGVSIARVHDLTMEAAAALQSGDRRKAEELFSQIADEERRSGLDDGRVLTTQALSAQERGDHQQARALLQRALAFYEDAFGAEHEQTILCLNNLAGAHRACGDLRQAEVLFHRVLAYQERVIGSEHADTAVSLMNLGGVLALKRDFKEATTLFRRALAIREKVLGTDHLRTGETRFELALALLSDGDDDRGEVEQLLRRALEIFNEELGQHPDTARCLEMLGFIVMENETRVGEAEQLLRRALTIRERIPDPFALVICLQGLARAVLGSELSREREAAALFRRAWTISELALGRENAVSQSIRRNLTTLERQMTQANRPARRSA